MDGSNSPVGRTTIHNCPYKFRFLPWPYEEGSMLKASERMFLWFALSSMLLVALVKLAMAQ